MRVWDVKFAQKKVVKVVLRIRRNNISIVIDELLLWEVDVLYVVVAQADGDDLWLEY